MSSSNNMKMSAAQQRQEFCVRWNSHLGSIGAAFPQLLAGQRFVDVTLACEGHQVHCHRLVLAACSSYFESILAENPCKHPVIILPSEIKLWEIQALVDFMYKGEVNVTLAGLPNLLRCAEQLRIRGLYGSDAALNLNQLKALTNKVAAPSASAAVAGAASNNTNDSTETDNESATTTTTTATTTNTIAAAHARDVREDAKLQMQQHQLQTNGNIGAQQQLLLQQQQHQQQQQKQQQQQQQQNNIQLQQQMLKQETNASNATEEDSADESTSNAYDNEDEYNQKTATHLESTLMMDEDGSFAGNDEDSFGGIDGEQDTSFMMGSGSGVGMGGSGSGNNNNSMYMMQKMADGGASAYKRIRRSEDSLAEAAKCVSKGQTFQTVSNMFNIPVSTIRFYMARKGILPKRKRGRGASTTAASVASNTIMSQTLAQMKRSGSPPMEGSYNMLGYQLPDTPANAI